MPSPKRLAFVLFAFSAMFAACGESSSSPADDDGAAGAPPTGADCASDFQCEDPALPVCTSAGKCGPLRSCRSDADCTEGFWVKCSQAGKCMRSTKCDVDADCRDGFQRCDTNKNCQLCLSDDDCPSEYPACVQHWEAGTYCAVCRAGDSSRCAAGATCTPTDIEYGGGTCEVPDCAADPQSKACTACINENLAVCLGDGGECTEALAALHACYVAEVPEWMEGDCPTTLPSERGCTPEACLGAAAAYDACLVGCAAVSERCGG